MKKLSILLLTHNRPRLFERCLNSVLHTRPFPDNIDVNIYVNNDSNDINEIHDPHTEITYTYDNFFDLSATYKSLFDRADGEYIFFLEDDDYIKPYFFNHLDLTFDINYVNYISEPLIKEHGPITGIKTTRQPTELEDIYDYYTFRERHKSRYFQLSQLIFRKKMLLDFPTGNDIHNDIRLFESFNKVSSLKYIAHPLWVQTTDGQDNISFDDLNKDPRYV